MLFIVLKSIAQFQNSIQEQFEITFRVIVSFIWNAVLNKKRQPI